MRYIHRVPSPPLSTYIDDIYCLYGAPRYQRLNVPPMPSAHLMISLAGGARLYDSDPAVPPATLCGGWFMGSWSRRFVVEHQEPVHLVGVHFKPWGLSPFIRTSMSELRDRWLPADALWGRAFHRLHDRIAGAASTAGMLAILEAELRERLPPETPNGLHLVNHAGASIEAAWGAMPVGGLSVRAGVSSNYLAAQFKEHVGLTPKRTARIYRFARVILSVDPRYPVDWSRLAHTAGFSDQAHFAKEFKVFTGHTPSEYVALRRRHPQRDGFPDGPMPVE